MPKVRLLGALLCIFFFTTASALLRGSPLPPPVVASASPNGRILVVAERDFDSPDQTRPRRVLGTTYCILETEQFINSKDRLVSSVPFYSSSWQVTIEGNDNGDEFWPMVSNDGRSLVLVRVIPGIPGLPVLQIYRRGDSGGKLVRTLQITDLWTPAQVHTSGTLSITGAEPQWFARGALNLSSNNQDLIYRTQWGNELLIDLARGTVRQNPQR